MWRFGVFLFGILTIFQILSAQPVTRYQPFATPVTDTCAIFTYQSLLKNPTGTIFPNCMAMLPMGNMMVAARAIHGATDKALLIKMSNRGQLISSFTIELPGKIVTITDLLYYPDNKLVIGGYTTDEFNRNKQGLLALCYTDGAIQWLNLLNMNLDDNNAAANKLLITLTDHGSICYTFGVANQLYYGKVNSAGVQQWSKAIQYPAAIQPVKAGFYASNQFYVAINSTDGGLPCGYLTGLGIANGQLFNSLKYGGAGQNSSFILHDLNLANNRPHVSGVYQKPNSGSFQYFWHRNSNASLTEYFHTVNIEGIEPDAFSKSRLENSARYFMYSGDNNNYSGFVYNETDAQRPRKNSKLFIQPTEVTLADAALGVDDGVVSVLSDEKGAAVRFIKTDSLGNLGACTQTSPAAILVDSFINFPQASQVVQIDAVVNLTKINATQKSFNLSNTQTCSSNNCDKPAILQDCIEGFNKQYNFYEPAGYFSRLTLTTINEPVVQTAVVNGWGVQIEASQQSGIAVFSNAGNVLHSAFAYLNDQPAQAIPFASKQAGLYLLHSSNNTQNEENLMIHLSYLDEAYEPKWAQTIRLPDTENQGYGIATLTEDEDKNVYIVAVRQKVDAYTHFWIVKLNKNGKVQWTKNVETEAGIVENVLVAVARNQVFVTAKEQKPLGSMLLKLDANTGTPVARVAYATNQMHLAIAEAGLFATDQYLFMLGNTQGSGENIPLLTQADHNGNIIKSTSLAYAAKMINADFKHQQFSLYLLGNGADNSFLLKTDTAFNLLYSKRIITSGGFLASGIQIAGDSSVYMSGVYINGVYKSNGALLKFDKQGSLGNCTSSFPVETDNYQSVTAITLPYTLNDGVVSTRSNQLQYLPITLRHAANLCNSAANCDTLLISGPTEVCSLGVPINYQWNTGSNCSQTPLFAFDTSFVNLTIRENNQLSVTFKQAGSTIISSSFTTGCNTFSDSLMVFINPGFNPNLLRDTTICTGDTIEVAVPELLTNVTWHDGSTANKRNFTNAGKYWFDAMDPCNATYSDTIVVKLFPPNTFFTDEDTSICNTQNFILPAPAGVDNLLWSNGSTQNEITISQSGNYGFTGIDANGCHTGDSIDVRFIACISGMQVPNAFTPNGDGLNDIFKPLTDLSLTQYSFTIYARWGQVLFSSKDLSVGWNGQFAGKTMPAGTYVWQLNYQTLAGQSFTEKGQVTLIR